MLDYHKNDKQNAIHLLKMFGYIHIHKEKSSTDVQMCPKPYTILCYGGSRLNKYLGRQYNPPPLIMASMT